MKANEIKDSVVAGFQWASKEVCFCRGFLFYSSFFLRKIQAIVKELWYFTSVLSSCFWQQKDNFHKSKFFNDDTKNGHLIYNRWWMFSFDWKKISSKFTCYYLFITLLNIVLSCRYNAVNQKLQPICSGGGYSRGCPTAAPSSVLLLKVSWDFRKYRSEKKYFFRWWVINQLKALNKPYSFILRVWQLLNWDLRRFFLLLLFERLLFLMPFSCLFFSDVTWSQIPKYGPTNFSTR